MAPSFPTPVLSVTPDAVRDLDGHEALSGLWTLFTKCKGSLKDGRRLENISWRLWYRELMLADRPPFNNFSSEGDLLDEEHSSSYPPSSSSSSSSAASSSSSSSSSHTPLHSPALSHTSLAYRPPTPAESVNIQASQSYAVHDPLILPGETASSMSLHRLNLTDLPPPSSSSATVPPNVNINTAPHNTTTRTHSDSSLPSPLPSPSIPQSIPQPIPPSTAPSIPHASGSTEPSVSRSDLSSAIPHPPAPPITQSQSQPTYVSPSPHFPNYSSSYAPSPSRPFLARTHTEGSVIDVMDANRTRRSSFAGMSVGRIIYDMLPKGCAESCSSAGGGCDSGRLAMEAEVKKDTPDPNASVNQAASLKVAPAMQMTTLATAAAVTTAAAISCLPTPATEETELRSGMPMPRKDGREEAEEGREEAREEGALGGAGEEDANMDRQPDGGAAQATHGTVASRAFAAHVAHVAGAAASEVAHALALAPGEAGGARQRECASATAAADRVGGGGSVDKGESSDRRGDKDKDMERTVLAPRGLSGDGYPVSGERVGPAGAEEERDTYSGTSTPTHIHTPPRIQQPLDDQLPQPPRLVVVNPTPNLTPHPTPPSTPVVFGGLPRGLAPGPGQWLMLPGQQQQRGQGPSSASTQMQQYHLQQAQLAQLLPPLTLPPPPQAALRTHVPDGASLVSSVVNISQSSNGNGSLHGPSTSSDRAEKSAASAGTAAGASSAAGSHAARGQRHGDAQVHSHSQHAYHSQSTSYFQQLQHPQNASYSQMQVQHGHHYSHLDGYSHAYAARGRADADAELVVPSPPAFLFGGTGTGADEVEGVHLLGLLPPLPAPLNSHANASGSGYNTPTPGPSANTTSGIGNVNGGRDNVNRRSISSNTSTSSQATTASLQSTRSHATDSSSATSASTRSKATTGEDFKTVVGGEDSDTTFGESHLAMGEVPILKGAAATMNAGKGVDSAGGKQNQRVDGMDGNDEVLEEEEDDPLSPLPTVTSFAVSISPRMDDKTSRSKNRHSAPPRSTSDSAQMRIALSLSPKSPLPLEIVDAQPPTAEVQSPQHSANANQPRAAVRSRSASSTRSVGKRSSFSASSKASRKGSMAPPPPPQVPTTTSMAVATSSTATASTSTKSASTTKAVGGTAVRRSSSTRSTSRSRSTAGSSLGQSRSRSREPGLVGLALGMTTTSANDAAAAVAAAVPPMRAAKPAVRGRAKFSLGRMGNKKSATALALRRNSSGLMGKAKAKQREEEEDEEDDDEEDGEEAGHNAGDDDEMIALGELDREVVEVQAERERREGEERMRVENEHREREERMRVENEHREREERERMYLQEQAHRAARAEEEKERRREAERQQRQLNTIAALTGAVTADNVSETSSKRPVRFNIGSNSDDGMGGKSAGSGSEVSGGVSGQSVGGGYPRIGGVKGKGKEKELSVEQRLAMQHQEYQPQQQYQVQQSQARLQRQYQPQQPHPNRSTGQYMHATRQLSKPQLHQLQIMEQMQQQQQQQRPTAAQQQAQQYLQQFQNQQSRSQRQQSPPQPLTAKEQIVAGVENNSTGKKGKQREAAVTLPVSPSAKPKKRNSKARVAPADAGVVDPILAQFKDSLNTPLLPTGKKRVELVSTESEFETTDDEEDDDGEWSSAEMTADDEEARQAREQEEQNRTLLLQIQQQHDRQMQLLQQQQREQQRQQQALRPQAPQRVHSSHYPAPNNARGKHLTRAQMQRQAQAQAQAQAAVDKAVTEAQRQRDMFVKLPTSSFQDLAKARTNSVGLLTQLMNPDVEKFPPNHPYRRGFSSGELRRSGISALSSMQPMTPVAAPSSNHPSPPPAATNADRIPATSDVAAPKPARSTAPPAPAPARSDAIPAAAPTVPSTSRPAVTRRNTADVVPGRAAFSPPLRSAGLVMTKSSAALPTATQLQVGSVATKHTHHTSAVLNHVNINASSGSGVYRPRGPPKDQEMEDDSESDGGAIQISKSVAQEKLKALAERRGIKATVKHPDSKAPGPSNAQAVGTDDNDVPPWVVSGPQAQHTRSQSHGEPVPRRLPAGLQLTQIEPEEIPPPPATAPIKVDYPYNLPLPMAPSTPRTTRRNMLSTELTESLRRNVLWHRHVDKPNPPIRRTTSGGGSRPGELRPLTAFPSMVQLHAKGTKPEGTSQIIRGEPLTDKEREEVRQRRLTRNKSWTNDYHYSGW